MDGLKVVPQIFFDLIGRVVPGALGIVACLLLSRTTWHRWLQTILGESQAKDSLTVAILLFLAASYVVGQFIAPAAKWLQRIGEEEYFHPEPKEKSYDWLRLYHPEAGALCAKIRAEFTMHNSTAVVLLVSAVVYPHTIAPWRWSVFIGLLFAGLLSAYRGKETRDTFNKTVTQFKEAAAKGPDIKPAQPAEQAKAASASPR